MSGLMELKPRQQAAFDAIFSAKGKGIQRQLVNLPTAGLTKTYYITIIVLF